MKNYGIFAAFIVCAMTFLAPQSSHAYLTTGQSASRVDGSGVLYAVSYNFGSDNYDFYMPMQTLRGSGSASNTVSYLFLDDSEDESAYGVSSGVVLSNAEVKNGQYFVPKGKARRFTLLVLLNESTVPSPAQSLDLALKVSSLPFTIVDKGKMVAGKLNPSELQYYITPEIAIPAASVTPEVPQGK